MKISKDPLQDVKLSTLNIISEEVPIFLESRDLLSFRRIELWTFFASPIH